MLYFMVMFYHIWRCDCFSHLTHNPQEALSYPLNLIYSRVNPCRAVAALTLLMGLWGCTLTAAVGPVLCLLSALLGLQHLAPCGAAWLAGALSCERPGYFRKPRNSSEMAANAIKKP